MSVGAVVLGASYRALAVVRSLGRHDIAVHVVKTDEHTVALRSRYTRSASIASQHTDELSNHLVELARRPSLRGRVLIPTHDEEAIAVARRHDILSEHYRVSTPDAVALAPAYDKRVLARLAQSVGVAQPWTASPDGPQDLAELDPPYPVVIKPAWKPELNALTVAKAWPASDATELADRYTEACSLLGPEALLVQELVPGGADSQLSVGVLVDHGAVIASVTARRIRQYPRQFGRASTFVETIERDEALLDAARRLLEPMEFTGIAEIEFKRDSRTGQALLLDFNPRAWGWISLCGRAGVDFPWLLYRQTVGDPVGAVLAEPGRRWLRVSTDLASVATSLRAGELGLGEWLRDLVPLPELAVFSRDDPGPALWSPWSTGRLLAGRVLHRRVVRG